MKQSGRYQCQGMLKCHQPLPLDTHWCLRLSKLRPIDNMWWGMRPNSRRKKKVLETCHIFWEAPHFPPYLWKAACSRPCLAHAASLSFQLLLSRAPLPIRRDLSGAQMPASDPCPSPPLSPPSHAPHSFLLFNLILCSATTVVFLVSSHGWYRIPSRQGYGKKIF